MAARRSRATRSYAVISPPHAISVVLRRHESKHSHIDKTRGSLAHSVMSSHIRRRMEKPSSSCHPDEGDRIPPERRALRCNRPLLRMSGGQTTARTGRAGRGACAAGQARTGGGKPLWMPTDESTQRRCDLTRRSAAVPAPTELRGG